MKSTPSRSLSLMATIILSAASAACGQDASAPNPAADSSPQQAPLASTSSPTPAQPPAKTDAGPEASASGPAPPGSSRRKCYLAVDAKVLVDEQCLVFPFGDGGYTLNAWSEGKPKNSHFAVVVLNADGSGTATWNADPDDDKAGDPLGTVRLRGDCWVNDRARICVS